MIAQKDNVTQSTFITRTIAYEYITENKTNKTTTGIGLATYFSLYAEKTKQFVHSCKYIISLCSINEMFSFFFILNCFYRNDMSVILSKKVLPISMKYV